MKTAITALAAMLLLTSCNGVSSNVGRPLTAPDVVEYSLETQRSAANEIRSGACPVLGDIFIPDYHVMRNQSRRLLNKPVYVPKPQP